jgi:hypothetical protein
VKKELQRQLQVFKEEQEDKHNKEKVEIEENLREQLEALKHEEQQKVQAELERQQAAEEEREKAAQKQQQDIAALQQELAGELEEKRSELQEQHSATLVGGTVYSFFSVNHSSLEHCEINRTVCIYVFLRKPSRENWKLPFHP